jgi:phage shock protein A
LAQLKTVEDAIRQKEETLSQIPASLANQKKNMATLKVKLNKIKQDKNAKIPRSAEEDQQQIAEIDSFWLSDLNSIKSALNL